MPARALVRWLIKLVAGRRVPFIAQHQVSHLSVATAEQRRSDHRVLLARADAAAERARGSHEHTLNISGSHPGVDDLGIYDKHGSLAGGIPQVKESNGPWGWPVVRQEEKKYQPPGSLGPRQPARRAIQGPWPLALGGVGGAQQQLHPGHVGGPRSHTAIACFDEGRTGCCITRRTAPPLCRHRLPAAAAASSGRRRRRCLLQLPPLLYSCPRHCNCRSKHRTTQHIALH